MQHETLSKFVRRATELLEQADDEQLKTLKDRLYKRMCDGGDSNPSWPPLLERNATAGESWTCSPPIMTTLSGSTDFRIVWEGGKENTKTALNDIFH